MEILYGLFAESSKKKIAYDSWVWSEKFGKGWLWKEGSYDVTLDNKIWKHL